MATQEQINEVRAQRAQFQAMIDAMDTNIPKISYDEIKPLYDDLLRECAANLEKDGYLAPVCFLVKRQDEGFALDVMALDFKDDESKERSITVVRIHGMQQKCAAALFVSESWTVEQRGEEAVEAVKKDGYQGVPPSEHPDRKEVVIARLEVMGESHMASAPITRDADDKPSVNVEELLDFTKYPNQGLSGTGRLTNWLAYNQALLNLSRVDKWLEENPNVRSH